jgi:hypothetical protein
LPEPLGPVTTTRDAARQVEVDALQVVLPRVADDDAVLQAHYVQVGGTGCNTADTPVVRIGAAGWLDTTGWILRAGYYGLDTTGWILRAVTAGGEGARDRGCGTAVAGPRLRGAPVGSEPPAHAASAAARRRQSRRRSPLLFPRQVCPARRRQPRQAHAVAFAAPGLPRPATSISPGARRRVPCARFAAPGDVNLAKRTPSRSLRQVCPARRRQSRQAHAVAFAAPGLPRPATSISPGARRRVRCARFAAPGDVNLARRTPPRSLRQVCRARRRQPRQAHAGTLPEPSLRSIHPCHPARLIQPVSSSPSHPARLIQPVSSSPSHPARLIQPVSSSPSHPARLIQPVSSSPSYPARLIQPVLSSPSHPARLIQPVSSSPSHPARLIQPVSSSPSHPARLIQPVSSSPSHPARLIQPVSSSPPHPARLIQPASSSPQ